MYSVYNIEGKDYKVEFTVEASLFKEGVETILEFIGEMSKPLASAKEVLAQMPDIPHKTVKLFYMGLLENHGIEGDNTVQNEEQAKALLKKFIKANAGDTEKGSFYGVLGLLLKQMEEDGFFNQIGLTQTIDGIETMLQKSNPKKKK